MTDESSDNPPHLTGRAAAARRQRQAAALRENLARRKQQARRRDAAEPVESRPSAIDAAGEKPRA